MHLNFQAGKLIGGHPSSRTPAVEPVAGPESPPYSQRIPIPIASGASHARQSAGHDRRTPAPGRGLHRLHDGHPGQHHLRQRRVRAHQRLLPGRAHGPAAQPGPPPGHAAGGLRRPLGHRQGRQALAGPGEEPLQERRLLLGGRQRHPVREQGEVTGYVSIRSKPSRSQVREAERRSTRG